jgi:hypothetical protein
VIERSIILFVLPFLVHEENNGEFLLSFLFGQCLGLLSHCEEADSF